MFVIIIVTLLCSVKVRTHVENLGGRYRKETEGSRRGGSISAEKSVFITDLGTNVDNNDSDIKTLQTQLLNVKTKT